MIARLEHQPLHRLYLLLVATGTITGALIAAATCVHDWACGRQP
ncbi:hypothetical protein [Streptomyces hygroscopicus]|nr:hypothetical protein [Streptomyces hygroscopicus]